MKNLSNISMKDFDWPSLYDRTEELLKEMGIPASVNRHIQSITGLYAEVTITIPAKGNKQNIEKLKTIKAYYPGRGYVLYGQRFIKGYIQWHYNDQNGNLFEER